MNKSGINVQTSNYYLDRNRDRVVDVFNNIEPWAKKQNEKNPDDWNYVTMSLFSYVDWAVFRKMADFSKHPGLTDFVARFQNLPGVSETAIPV